MRYIDADALKSIKSIQIGNFNTIETIQKWIDEQPTADVVERKRGEWIDFSMSIKGIPTEACGECGEWSYGMGKNFCPNCGADMRKEVG